MEDDGHDPTMTKIALVLMLGTDALLWWGLFSLARMVWHG